MERNNFFGLDKFIWWVGEIPNHDDVVNLKRVLDNYIEDYKDYNEETQNGSN